MKQYHRGIAAASVATAVLLAMAGCPQGESPKKDTTRAAPSTPKPKKKKGPFGAKQDAWTGGAITIRHGAYLYTGPGQAFSCGRVDKNSEPVTPTQWFAPKSWAHKANQANATRVLVPLSALSYTHSSIGDKCPAYVWADK